MPKPKSKTTRPTPPSPRPAKATAAVGGPRRNVSGGTEVDGSGGAGGAGIRVLCVDDHAVLVEGLKAQFTLDPSIRCIGSLPTAERLLEEVARLKPDVVLLDIEMPGPDAFEMADRLRHMHPRTRVIILSAHIRDGYINAAFKCGAWGYFAKSDDLNAIVAGIREGARSSEGGGTVVLGPKVKSHCAPPIPANTAGPGAGDRFSMGNKGTGGTRRAPRTPTDHARPGAPTTRLDALSVREVEVLRLIGKGLSRTQIAAELARAVKTIDGHQDRIIEKLGVESRADLMRLAIREGFAEA